MAYRAVALRREAVCRGLAAVAVNGKWGMIDTAGNTVILFDYDSVQSVSSGDSMPQRPRLDDFRENEEGCVRAPTTERKDREMDIQKIISEELSVKRENRVAAAVELLDAGTWFRLLRVTARGGDRRT